MGDVNRNSPVPVIPAGFLRYCHGYRGGEKNATIFPVCPIECKKDRGDFFNPYQKNAGKIQVSLIALQRVNGDDPHTGFAGIVLILPAGIACPAPAKDALAEP
jgi:hypothetical protein